jgi:hypothetical protein
MQLAERWLGFGMIAVACVALAPPLMSSSPPIAKHEHVALTSYRCSEPRQAPAPAPVEDDPYTPVFERARPQLQHCFGPETRVELLITIEPDGRVAKVSHRPDPSTPATRCLTEVIERLQFPASSTAIAIRLPLTRR